MANSESKKTVVSFVINHDDQMRELNAKAFKKDHPTDVISYPIQQGVDEDTSYAGEIIMDQDEIRRNAAEYGVPFEQELARVVAHGVLHLFGFEDDTPEKKSAMKAIEDAIVEEIS